jgi:hypothetical protein
MDPRVGAAGSVRHHAVPGQPLQHSLDLGLNRAAGCLPLPAEKAAAIELQHGKKSPTHRDEI